MSLLDQTVQGVTLTKDITTIVGTEGVGKTTFASHFPRPLFLDIEDGSKHLDVARLGSDKLKSLADILAVIDDLEADKSKAKYPYDTLIIDSITILEQYTHEHLLAGSEHSRIDDFGGGYGKGHTASREEIYKLMQRLKKLRDSRDMDIILVGHVQIKNFTDPDENVSYDRYQIQANDKFSQIIKAQSDNVLFCSHKVNTTKDKRTKKTLAFGSGDRIIKTEFRPGADAKNRWNLPSELPLDYDAYMEAKAMGTPRSASELKEEIKALLPSVEAKIKELAIKKVKEAGDNAPELLRIKKKLLESAEANN